MIPLTNHPPDHHVLLISMLLDSRFGLREKSQSWSKKSWTKWLICSDWRVMRESDLKILSLLDLPEQSVPTNEHVRSERRCLFVIHLAQDKMQNSFVQSENSRDHPHHYDFVISVSQRLFPLHHGVIHRVFRGRSTSIVERILSSVVTRWWHQQPRRMGFSLFKGNFVAALMTHFYLVIG